MAIQSKIREIEKQQQEINELQKYIGQYGKTRKIYQQYRASGYDQSLLDVNYANIALHKAAKKYFDERGFTKKLPSINQLREQWAELEKQRRPLRADYKAANQKFKDLCTAKSNASRMLGVEKKRENPHGHDIAI